MHPLQEALDRGRVLLAKGIARSRTTLTGGISAGLVAGLLAAGSAALLVATTPSTADAIGAGAAAVRTGSARHTRLLRSAPPNDTSLAAAPRSVTLWFTKPVQPKLSRLQLTDASGAKVETAALRATSDSATVLEARITGAMKPGAYTVAWTTTSRDSHVIKGTLHFRVTGSASLD